MTATVVIPVHADPDGLAQTLAALADAAPVVVAVDGPHPATEAVAHAAGARVVVLPTSQGSYAARNAALDVVPDDVTAVLFTDAGCLPQPGWVEGHLRALTRADLSGGAVRVTHGPHPTPAEWVDRCRNLRQQAYVLEGGYAATCNLAVRRELLRRIRFDASLRSGGDREFCVRATATGASLVYTADAIVDHPARSTSAAVLTKARRVGRGIATLPAASRPTPRAMPRPHRGLIRQARAAGLRTNPLWGARVAWLDYRRAKVLREEALRPAPVQGLHVVVLLASRWSSLQSMNTRWRRIVQEWAGHPDVGRVTLVDHPRFRSRAWALTRPGESWLPGVDVIDLTVPTRLSPGPGDALAWWRAARALRAALPPADERLIVCTSPISSPLLQHLHDPATRTAFDAVDIWRNLGVRRDLGARLTAGYPAVRHAGVVTAVSASLAERLRAWTASPVTVVPNGVDLSTYDELRPGPGGLPDRPFAVYVGSLSSRLDLDLTLRVAELLSPGVPVVLAGPAEPDVVRRIEGRPGIHWIGPVDTELVPGLLQRAAVGLIPHLDTAMTEALDSMKLLEYGAAGLPVVSTEIPGNPPDVVVASDAAGFAAAVARLAAAPRRHEPAEWVVDRDWGVVADQLLSAMLQRPAARPSAVVVR
jgi:glycosyltransferase involved in cell wall biosynthesis